MRVSFSYFNYFRICSFHETHKCQIFLPWKLDCKWLYFHTSSVLFIWACASFSLAVHYVLEPDMYRFINVLLSCVFSCLYCQTARELHKSLKRAEKGREVVTLKGGHRWCEGCWGYKDLVIQITDNWSCAAQSLWRVVIGEIILVSSMYLIRLLFIQIFAVTIFSCG